MSAFSIYVLGACISGFIFMMLTFIPSFFSYLNNSIDTAKNEMKNSEKYDDMEMSLIDAMDNNSVIDFLNIIIVLISWVGLVLIIIYILSWLLDRIKTKFK